MGWLASPAPRHPASAAGAGYPKGGAPPEEPATRSGDADIDDLQLEDPARDRHFHLVAKLLAQQALADGTGDEDLVLVVVFLARADQDEVFFFIEVDVE